MLVQNVQSIRNKNNLIEAFLYDKDFKILCFAEHWLTEEEVVTLKLEGFKVASSFCRKNKGYGGVLILIASSWDFIPLAKINKLSLEQICEISAIYIPIYNLTIVNIYRSPSANLEYFLEILDRTINQLDFTTKVLICGDFNVKFNSNENDALDVINLLESYNFTSSVSFSTRGQNQLDNIFHNYHCNLRLDNMPYPKASKVLSSFSDHNGISLSLPVTMKKDNDNSTIKLKEIISHRPITESGKYSFYNALDNTDWNFINTTITGDRAFDLFFETFLKYFDYSFPVLTFTSKSNSYNDSKNKSKVKWFNKNLISMREKLHRLEKNLINKPTDATRTARNSFRRNYRRALKLSKIETNSLHITASDNIAKATWDVINKSRNIPSKQVSCSSISPDDFNAHFVNIAKDICNTLPPSNICPLSFLTSITSSLSFSFSFQEVTINEVRDAINSIKKSKTADTYGLTTSLLKSMIDVVTIPLTKVINRCIATSCFPDALKIAAVLPLFKKGDSLNLNNYRPISLLPVISKVFEKVMFRQIYSYFLNNTLFTKTQYGFQNGKSTCDAILQFINSIIEGWENKQFCMASFIDLCKAFDCVPHKILIDKLKLYGFDDNSCLLVNAYLSNRKQYVRVNNKQSETLNVDCGVPQGSILGPLLFIIFINDFPSCIDYLTILFADDTTFQTKSDSYQTLVNLRDEVLNQVSHWFTSNKLSINQEKTQHLVLSLRKHDHENPECVKFLGIYVDPYLRWDMHVSHLYKKLCKTIYILRNLRNCVTRQVLLVAYFSLFQSHLTYALLAWGHSSTAKRIFALQRRAVRIMYGASYRAPCKDIFTELKIMTLPSLYIHHCLMYIHKNRDNYTTLDEMHSYGTRYGKDILLPRLRLSTSRFSVNHYAIKYFNSLPEEIKELNCLKFKNKIKELLLNGPIFSIDENPFY